MVAPSLADLRKFFYGASSVESNTDAEYRTLLRYYEQGIDFGSLNELTELRGKGAAISQTSALALRDRWLALARASGSAVPPSNFNCLGGDTTDCINGSGDDLLWFGADWFDSGVGAVDPATDLYTTTILPVGSALLLETVPGTFTSQVYRAGAAGLWIDSIADGGYPAGTNWWPIAAVNAAGTVHVACWRVQRTGAGPHGGLIENDIVTLGGLLTYSSHIDTGIGDLTDDFWISGILRDTTHTYIFGMQFVPSFDARVNPADTHIPNYVLGDPENHYSLTRVARVVHASFLNVAAWEFWNGETWVADVTQAEPIVDTSGRPIRGDAGFKKIADGHYVQAAHILMGPYLASYKSSVPQGPYTLTGQIPTPNYGQEVNGGIQVGQLTKVLPNGLAVAESPPPEHSTAMVSSNLINEGYAFTDPITKVSIRRFGNQFFNFPNF